MIPENSVDNLDSSAVPQSFCFPTHGYFRPCPRIGGPPIWINLQTSPIDRSESSDGFPLVHGLFPPSQCSPKSLRPQRVWLPPVGPPDALARWHPGNF